MKGPYNTKNRELLRSYLRDCVGQHVTVQDICDHFRGQMGTTTVYRQLERMVEEGLVHKYLLDGAGAAYFEYVDQDHCGEQTCFHCKCEKCGKLMHLHCEELQSIQSHIMAHHGFRLDSMKTVFYGVCEQCG